jgi:hypothetical protein
MRELTRNRTLVQMIAFAILMLATLGGVAFGFYQSIYWRIEQSNTKFNQKIAVLETAYLSDVETSSTLTTRAARVMTAHDIEITSPALTFNVNGKQFINLSSDQNITGVHPLGGVVNQVIYVAAGRSGSNTMRFDDGTSTALGANMTLTEGQDDVLGLICRVAPAATNGAGIWAAFPNNTANGN